MRSSYKNTDITYGDLIETVTQIINPKNILEIGILDGYSLESFTKTSSKSAQIDAFDIFNDFNGNHSDKAKLISKFETFPNVKIEYGDFYKLHNTVNNYDLIHIDIANTGETFEYVMKNYLSKLSCNGAIIFEGGSITRDNVEWMKKYQKKSIYPVIQEYVNNGYNIRTYGDLPSITIIKH